MRIRNGIVIVILGLIHTQFVMSENGFGQTFAEFAQKAYFEVSPGMAELPAKDGLTNYRTFAAFWFAYFGVLMIPIGLLAHSIEKDKKPLPYSFTISYFIVCAIGAYMVPNSGMTRFLLPHALFMIGCTVFQKHRAKKKKRTAEVIV